MRAVGVDFDGVIHAYSQGWRDGSIYDQPLPGAVEAIKTLMDRFAVFVHTTRDPYQVEEWLTDLGLPAVIDDGTGVPGFWDRRGLLLVTNRKYAAVAYIDDRAIRFETWDQALADLAVATAGSSF